MFIVSMCVFIWMGVQASKPQPKSNHNNHNNEKKFSTAESTLIHLHRVPGHIQRCRGRLFWLAWQDWYDFIAC